MRVLGVLVLVLALASPAAGASWTRPSLLLSGDEAGLAGTVVRPDGTLRAAIWRPGISLGLMDGTKGDPLVVLRPPTLVANVVLAADGSGVALTVQRHGPTSVVAFDAAGAARPPVTIDDSSDGP